MKIRAPKSGYVSVLRPSSHFLEGEQMFLFSDEEETLAVSKASLALSIVEMLHDRLIKLDNTGLLEGIISTARKTAETTQDAFAELAEYLRGPAEQGIILPHGYYQAISLSINSRADYKTTDVGGAYAQLNIDEYKRLLPLQIAYCQEVRQYALSSKAKVRVTAPAAGNYSILIPSGAWVKRNDIIAVAENA